MNEIKCVMCDKIIGEDIYDGAISSPLGAIPCYHQKMDYRKAAHVYFNGRDNEGKRKHGNICKKCARQYWTEGKSYIVYCNNHGKPISVGGDNGSRFYTKQNAIECKERLKQKNPNTRYWIEERAI